MNQSFWHRHSVALTLAAVMTAWPIAAAAQSSSLFARTNQGQHGSNQPNVIVIVADPADGGVATSHRPAAAAAAAPGRVIGEPSSSGAPVQATSLAAPTAEGSFQPSVSPVVSGHGRPIAPYAAGYPSAGPSLRDPNSTPAVWALQRASFTATIPPAPRAFGLHDLVTIIVREETSYTSDSETDLEKKYSIDAKLEKWIALKLNNMQVVPTELKSGSPAIKGSASRKFEGDGEVARRDQFIGRLTAEIVDIKPNGTLLLSARKFIKTDDEEQCFQVTGLCRPDDVNADNTVLSTQLADLTVEKVHRGALRDTTKRGWAPWLADKINGW